MHGSRMEGSYVEGKKDGHWGWRDKYGQIVEEATYVNGRCVAGFCETRTGT